MRFGSAPEQRGLRGCVLGALAVSLGLALAVVAPTNGLCNPKLHELVLVHPIFSHHHEQDPHAAHRDPDAPSAARPGVGGTLALAPLGLLGAGLGVAYEGMLAAAPLGLLFLAYALAIPAQRRLRFAQAFHAVPTGPPRLAPS